MAQLRRQPLRRRLVLVQAAQPSWRSRERGRVGPSAQCVSFSCSLVRIGERGKKRRLRLWGSHRLVGTARRNAGVLSGAVRESRGSESVLGTFVLDSPSKVLFSSILMAQLCVSRFSADLSRSGSAQPPWRSREREHIGFRRSPVRPEGAQKKRRLRLDGAIA